MLKLRENSKISTLHLAPYQSLSFCSLANFSAAGTSDCLNPSQPSPIQSVVSFDICPSPTVNVWEARPYKQTRKKRKTKQKPTFRLRKISTRKAHSAKFTGFFYIWLQLAAQGEIASFEASSVSTELNAAVKAAVILLDHRNFDCWPWLLRPLWLLHPWWKRMHCEQKILQPLLKL